MKYKNLEDLYNFCAIVDHGSLQAASKHLRIPAPTLSRRLKYLEQVLGIKLLHRSAHHLHLTIEGEAYYNQLSPHFKQLDFGLKTLNDEEGELEGDIILAIPEGMLNICMNAWIVEFLKLWPKVNILLEKAATNHELEVKNVDIAVKLMPEGPADWKMKKMFSNEKWLVAAPEYLANHPPLTQPEQLENYDKIINDDNQVWQFIKNGKLLNLKLKPRYKPFNLFHALDASLMGLGISYYPRFLVEKHVVQGELVQLLPTFTVEEASIYLFYADQSLQSHRVRKFVEFLKQKAQNPEDIFDKFALQSPVTLTQTASV